MAESTINMTEGSGKKQHTWNRTIGANSVEDDFNLPGEYPYASYFAIAAATSVATANDHVLELMAGSSLNVRIRRIRLEQSANATSATVGTFQILRLSSAGSGGSAVTPAKFDTADGAAGATAMTLPSSKGTETTLLMPMAMDLRQAVLATSAQMDDSWEWTQLPGQKPIIIAAGTSNGICVKNTAGFAAATVNVIIEFVETTFV